MAKGEKVPTKKLAAAKRAKSKASVTRGSAADEGRDASSALISRLDVQQSLLSQIKSCNDVLQSNADDAAVLS